MYFKFSYGFQKVSWVYLSYTSHKRLLTFWSDLLRRWSSQRSLTAVTHITKIIGMMEISGWKAFTTGTKFNAPKNKKYTLANRWSCSKRFLGMKDRNVYLVVLTLFLLYDFCNFIASSSSVQHGMTTLLFFGWSLIVPPSSGSDIGVMTGLNTDPSAPAKQRVRIFQPNQVVSLPPACPTGPTIPRWTAQALSSLRSYSRLDMPDQTPEKCFYPKPASTVKCV